MSLQALIFDVDGTLAETERAGHRMAFNRAFSEAGFDWYWDKHLYADLLAIGGGRERIVAFLKHYQKDISLRDAAKTRALIDQLHARKGQHFKDLVAEGAVQLRPGIKRLLLEAKGIGVRLAVATNCSSISLEAICQNQLGGAANEWFDVLVTGDQLQHKKPHPDAYRLALQALELAAEKCIAFEDSYIGLTSASANQITTVVTAAEYTLREDFSQAALVVSDLGEPQAPMQVLTDMAGSFSNQDCINIDMLKTLLLQAKTKTAD